MADARKRVEIVIDFLTGQSAGSFAKLRTDLSTTEGAWGKTKLASGAAKDAMIANAGSIALVAGGALATFAAKSITAFQDTALAVGKFRDATGLSLDAASRWKEVAGDLGVELGTVETAIGRMNTVAGKTPEKFDALGVSIATTKDGAFDANGTFLNVIDALQKTEDPAKRAALAQDLLGKSWRELAEVINDPNLRSNLAAVSDAKIIDQEELDKARRFREAMDNLKDTFEDIQLTVGEFVVPAMTDLANSVGLVKDAFDLLPGGLGTVTDALSWFSPMGQAGKVMDGLRGIRDGLRDVATDDVTGVLGETITKFDALQVSADNLARQGLYVTAQDAENARDALAEMGDAASDTETKWKSLMDELKQEEGLRSVKEQFAEVETAAFAAYTTAAAGSADAKDAAWEHEGAVLDTKQAVLDYIESLGGIPDQELTNILAQIDQGKYQGALDRLEFLTNPRIVWFEPRVRGTIPGQVSARAEGGPVLPGGTYLVGERGPELLQMGSAGGTVIPNQRIGAGRGTTVNIDARNAIGLDPNALARVVTDAVKRAERIGVR